MAFLLWVLVRGSRRPKDDGQPKLKKQEHFTGAREKAFTERERERRESERRSSGGGHEELDRKHTRHTRLACRIDELVADWQPEPLVPPKPAFAAPRAPTRARHTSNRTGGGREIQKSPSVAFERQVSRRDAADRALRGGVVVRGRLRDLRDTQRQERLSNSRWCLRVGETVSGDDDRECSGKPRDLCESLELFKARIGLDTTELRVKTKH